VRRQLRPTLSDNQRVHRHLLRLSVECELKSVGQQFAHQRFFVVEAALLTAGTLRSDVEPLAVDPSGRLLDLLVFHAIGQANQLLHSYVRGG
jgi:hypothetical protein